MKNLILLGVSLMSLAACATAVPDSGQGVGFNDYAAYEVERARREASLRGDGSTTISQNTPILPPTQGVSSNDQGISSAELASAGINTGATNRTANVAPAALGSNPNISDEQSFDAVSSRESIESDAQRRDRQAAAYQLIEATAVPDRPGDEGPNIVQYALQAPNNRGESVFTRSGLAREGRFQRNCAAYRTPDDAQRDFLESGGPSRDRLGIDPDGDGFACGWDPQAFRGLASGN